MPSYDGIRAFSNSAQTPACAGVTTGGQKSEIRNQKSEGLSCRLYAASARKAGQQQESGVAEK
ncbi:MAG: hypothetical protein ACK5X3_03915 [Pseudomonadota bacterium]